MIKDIDAGEKVNCKTIFMDYDYHEHQTAKVPIDLKILEL